MERLSPVGELLQLPETRPKDRGTVLYDFEWIKRNISIVKVARQLGIIVVPSGTRTRWIMAHCWRTENHKAADRSPSLGFSIRNRFKCFNCDDKTRSNLDLVSEVKEIDTRRAAEWIAARFPGVPTVARRKPTPRDHPEFRAGITKLRDLEDYIRAGLLTQLRESELKVLLTVWSHRDGSGIAEVSYSQIMDCAALGSRTTVARALVILEGLELVCIERGWQPGTGRRAPNRVLLTLDCNEDDP